MRVDNRIDRNRDRALFEKASAATCLLSEVLGSSADRVSVEWTLLTEQGPGGFRQAARLQLSDPLSGTVATTFAPDEFDNLLHLKFRLHDLWGDLLQLRSHRQLDELERLMSTGHAD